MEENDKSNPDRLSDIFNVESEITKYEPPIEIFPKNPLAADNKAQFEEYVDADYAFARENIMDSVLKAADALDSMIGLAKASQAPRAFEVVATLTKVILDGNKDLLELAKKNKELKQEEYSTGGVSPGNVTNNNLIVTTEELRQMLADQGISGDLKSKVYTKPVNNTKEA